MRAVIQRVNFCKVFINNILYSQIKSGLLVFLAINPKDTNKDVNYIVNKILNLRIFEDKDQKMNLSALDLKKEIMVVSQFTLYGDCRKGRRPSFIQSANPKEAEIIYNQVINELKKSNLVIKTGKFQTEMQVELVNNGPVTLLLDSMKVF